MPVRVRLHAPGKHTSDSVTAQDLSVQLQLLKAVQVYEEGDPEHEVVLVGWPMGQAVMEALAGLPAGNDNSITCKRCLWPLEHTAYKQFAHYAPPAYTTWHLGSQLSVDQVISIIAGADVLRVRKEGGERLGVTVTDGLVFQEVQRMGYQDRHVELFEAWDSDSEYESGSEYESQSGSAESGE